MNQQKVTFLLVSIFSFFGFFTQAAEPQYWSSLQVSAPLKNDFSLYGELVNRFSGDKEDFVTRSNRLGIVYKINPDLSYAIILENRDTDRDTNDEIRLINQLQHQYKFDFMKLTTRLRIENREFSNTPVYALRGRLSFRGDFDKLAYGSVTPFASFEQFYIFNDTVGRPEGSTEKRNQAGISFPVSFIDAKADLSYLDRIVERASGLGLAEDTNTYSIVNLVLKWGY